MLFSELSDLQRRIAVLRARHVSSLSHYHLPSGGFQHLFGDKSEKRTFSKASTATCVLSLIATGHWEQEPWSGDTQFLITNMLDEDSWESAGLNKKNPFTVAFLLEAVAALGEVDSTLIQSETAQTSIKEAVTILQTELQNTNGQVGAVCIPPYPPHAYLTQLAVRVLKRLGELSDNIRSATLQWAWQEIDHELALVYSGIPTADALSLAYTVILVSICSTPSEATPVQNQLLRKAIDTVFEAQLPDGSWPISKPMFHYPKVGNAYCYEYEMLTQLLQIRELEDHVIRHLPKLALTVKRLEETGFRFEEEGWCWASGHHPQLPGPESWSTASVYHYLYELDRTLAEAVRRSVFSYIGVDYTRPRKTQVTPSESRSRRPFAGGILDSELKIGEESLSLKEVLFERFVRPVATHASRIEQGIDLPDNVPISAIFFGPPGTAKTRLAREIAEYLEWPLLTIDPSHLVRRGLDQVQAETNTVFSMLAALERAVVLLDEFDEMVRERTSQQSEVVSRFLTTAMLPKLALINERRRIVFIVATNHIDQFDFAIRRPGRFDILIQVMPPRTDAKLAEFPAIKEVLERHRVSVEHGSHYDTWLSELTFAEFAQLAEQLSRASNPDQIKDIIRRSHERCSLVQEARGEGRTWAEICREQSAWIRVPHRLE